MNRQFTIDDVFLPGATGGEPDRVRQAFHAPDLLSGSEIGQRDSAAEQLGMSYGEADAGFDDASTELKIRKAEAVPGADKWVQDAPENVTFLQEDADGLMAVYDSLRQSGFLSEDDLDEGTAEEIAQNGHGLVDTLERSRLANERTDLGAAVLEGSLTPEEARAKLADIDNRMASLAKRRNDPAGFYSFVEQGYRMVSRDLPQAGYRALEGGLAGATAGMAAGAIAGTAVPVVGNLTGAVGGGVAGGIAGVGAGLSRGMYESAQRMESANFLADLLNEKDDAGNYLDVDEILEKAQLYGMGSALVEMAGDALSVGATKLIAPFLKTAAANLGGRTLSLFTKDAIKAAIKNKQAWPVMRRFLLGMGAGAAAEGAEEAVQEGVSASIEAWLKNSLNEEGKAYFRDEQEGLFSAETWAAMAESGLEGAKVGAWFVLLPGIAQLFVDAGKVSRAREFAKGVKDVGAVVANSATAQMAPARMDTFLQANGLNQTVYIPADAAWQMQTQGTDLVTALGWTQESLEEAASLRHDIAVPLSRLVSRLDTGTLNAVADIMREGPNAMNVFEAEEPNSFLQEDVDAINAAAEEWEFEQDMLDAELDRVRSAITEAVRSVPGLLQQIVGSADTETSVGTYVDTIVTLIEQAANRLRVYGDDVGSIIQKLNFEGLIRGADGRLHTAEEIEQMVAEEAQAEADRPFWDNVWGRLDADSLKRDFPDARRELAQKHGYGLFSRKGEGLSVDELADILKNAGWLEQDADSSTLVEMLKSKKRPKGKKAEQTALGLFQFLGERGAAALDAADEATFRMDNLDVARQMEEAGKDAAAIKLATGWERGADGKWRYEIDDSQVQVFPDGDRTWRQTDPAYTRFYELNDAYGTRELTPEEEAEYDELEQRYDAFNDVRKHFRQALEAGKLKLKDILGADEVFAAYPEIAELPVRFGELSDSTLGAYTGEAILLNERLMGRVSTAAQLKSVLLHEVQHAIQRREGFASGGNEKTARTLASKPLQELLELVGDEAETYARNAEELAAIEFGLDRIRFTEKPSLFEKTGEYLRVKPFAMPKDKKERASALESLVSGWIQERSAEFRSLGHGWWAEYADKQELEERRKKLKAENRKLAQSAKDAARATHLLDKLDEMSDYDIYHSLAGEVEARNTQRRMDMTYEERLASLASSTEDVARKDQIFLQDALGGAMASIDENIENGTRALERLLAQKDGVAAQVMFRKGVGYISFLWGEPGTETNGFHDGYGISHIIAARNAQGDDGAAVARKLVEVIAKGDIFTDKRGNRQNRVTIRHDGYVAILDRHEKQGQKIWLLTGYKKTLPGDKQAVNAQQATQQGQMEFSDQVGAGRVEGIIPDNAPGVNALVEAVQKQNSINTLEQRAWHGSPRDFDRFDFSYMGKGEGHQVHGWGGYVAARKSISDKRYRERLAKGSKFVINGERVVGEDADFLEREAGGRALYEAETSGDFAKLRQELKERIEHYRSDTFTEKLINLLQSQIDRIDQNPKLSITKFLEGVPASDKYRFDTLVQFARYDAKDAGRRANIADVRARIVAQMEPFVREREAQLRTADRLEKFDLDNLEVYKNEGQLFELEIPEEEEMLIEWKYFYEQTPAIQEAILRAFGIVDDDNTSELVKLTNANLAKALYTIQGKDIYSTLVSYLGSPKAASLALLKEGVQGISYTGGIDGQAWVIFDEKKIEIIQKYYAMQAATGQTYKTAEIQRLDDGDFLIRLFRGANLSTLAHEISHAVHLEMERLDSEGKGTDALKRDLDTLRRWQSKYDDEAALRAEYDRYYKGLYGVEFDDLDAVGKLAVKQRAQREMVARGFELYLREGEAPTPGMEAVFRRMGKWMKRVYASASQLDVEISDDVREVFDRWLASEEDIAAAAAANDIHGFTAPLLDSLGLQGADRLELEGMISDAMGKASDALRRERARYRRDHVQQWREEVEQELAADPVYQARAAMRRTPIDLDAVVDTYGQELADALRVKLPASMKKGGDNPEALAFDYGFRDAGQMIQAILNRPGTQELRKELLAQKMQDADAQFAAEDFLFEQEELRNREDRIGEALYRLELESRTAMGRPVSPSQQEFEDFGSAEKNRWKIAREQLRTLVSNLLDEKEAQAAIQPDSYRRAASKAMRAERRAILAKDWAEAVKQNYLARVNMEAAYQAGKRRDLVNKLRRQAKRFLDSATPDTRARFAVFGLSQKISLFDPTMKMVQNAADKSLDDVREFLEKMKDEGFYTVDAQIPQELFEGQKQSWKLMDWKELQPYLEGMTVLMHMERESRKANSEAARQAWREEMDALAEGILALNPHRNPPADQKKRLDIVRFLKGVHASHLKAETIALLLDGDQDMGPVWRAVIAPINRAQADRDRRMKQARDEMKKLFSVYEPSEWVDMRGKRIFVPGLGRGLTKEQMLAVMLNAGNESNLERLRGMGYKDNEIRAIIDMLDERDVRFVQSVWDYLETFRKESFDLEESLSGVRPQAIEAKPLQTRFGELRGGYYPVSYDPQESSKPIDEESLGTLTGSMMPAVDHGSMKQRTATGLGTPLKLTLEVVPNHVAKTLHMLAFREPVRQVARVLNDKAVNAAIESTMGVEISKALKDWLHYVAGERPGVNGWSKALSMLRKNSALYSMGVKLTTILAQFTGLLASTAEIGPRWVAAGLVRTYCRQNPFTVYRETAALSPMMENRMKSVDRDLYEMSTGLMAKGSSNKVLDKFVKFQHLQDQYAFLPVGFVQMAFADLPTWQGAYAKAIHEGKSQSEAIEYADAIVTRTQVGGADKDLAGVQTGQELGKIMTQFYSYFSALYQLYARRMTMLKRSGYSKEAWARLATLFLLTGVAEPILSALFTRDTPEDDEDWATWAAQKVFFNPWNMIVGVRDVFGAVESLVDGYGGKSRTASLLNDSIDSGVRFLSQLAKGEDMDPKAALKAGWKSAGLLTGMVNAQELLAIEAFWDWLEDSNPDFELADLIRRKKK